MFEEFLSKMPALCGCRNAERKGATIARLYHEELSGELLFARNDEDRADLYNRCEVAFSMLRGDPNGERGAIEQCERLVHIMEWRHYAEDHGETNLFPLIEQVVKNALVAETNYPTIAAVFSVAQATSARWST